MADALALYRKKRNFARTPEPAEGGEASTGALRYVIQKHWASHLHYDLRLELAGTMKSWAVPKGPSFDPKDKRMAVQVEDHPIAYNTFEGQIPPGQYGAGKVIVWDKGHWTPIGDAAKGYEEGKLKFELHGHKLKGHWTLVRMRADAGGKGPPWLLIKEHDEHERPADEFNVVEELPDSVSSLQTATPKKAALPDQLSPQLATLAKAPPTEVADWLWELKFDGYRLLARKQGKTVRLFTRNGHDWTGRIPTLAKEVAALPLKSGWLDGEVMVVDEEGVPNFQALQNAFDAVETKHLVYVLFDLPFADSLDLRPLPVQERRERLRALMEGHASDLLRFSESFDAPSADLLASACQARV